MKQFFKATFRPSALRLFVLPVLFLFLHGCAGLRSVQIVSLPTGYPEEKIERNQFVVAKDDDVIGRLAAIRIQKGDTLPDVARHFSLGLNEISVANPGVDLWVPEAGKRILLPLRFILPDAPRKGIVINLAAMRLFQFRENGEFLKVATYPVGIGTEERPSPEGQMSVTAKRTRPSWHVPASIAKDHRDKGAPLPPVVPPGPLNPLGEYALYLSRSSYLIHGTNKPASIGLKATNGCIRLYPENIDKLYAATPVNTPVRIVNQPYLVGQRQGVVYISVHTPVDDTDALELEKTYLKLRQIQRKSGRKIEWEKVERALAEASGIPVAISGIPPGMDNDAEKTIFVRHPGKLYGKPEIPEMTTTGWYLLAGSLRDAKDAAKLAAIINRQGPPIPARVLAKSDKYRIVAGPFSSGSEAKVAMKRLKIDLGIDAILLEP